jgi:hypothetical protein
VVRLEPHERALKIEAMACFAGRSPVGGADPVRSGLLRSDGPAQVGRDYEVVLT